MGHAEQYFISFSVLRINPYTDTKNCEWKPDHLVASETYLGVAYKTPDETLDRGKAAALAYTLVKICLNCPALMKCQSHLTAQERGDDDIPLIKRSPAINTTECLAGGTLVEIGLNVDASEYNVLGLATRPINERGFIFAFGFEEQTDNPQIYYEHILLPEFIKQ
jgi:hypothetical protein